MSRIPLPRAPLGNGPRRSNIPHGPPLKSTVGKTPVVPGKRGILLNDTKAQSPSARSVPESLAGHPRIYGNAAQAEELWRHVKSVAVKIFVPSFCGQLFPNSLSALKNIAVSGYDKQKSRIPAPRNSSITPEFAVGATSERLDLSIAFDELRKFSKEQSTEKVRLIADFCLLYAGVVILFCVNDADRENQEQALFFLKQLLRLDLGPRPHEFSILFAILIRQGAGAPAVRGASIDVLAQLADLDADVYARVVAGASHRDRELSDLCREAIGQTTRHADGPQQPTPRAFAEIPSDAPQAVVVERLASYLRAFDEPLSPPEPIAFLRNVLRAVRRLVTDAAVLLNGSECLRVGLRLCRPCPVELAAQVLEFCFEVLSGELFYDGPGSFEAVEAVQNLSNDLFAELPQDILLPAVAAAVATTRSDTHLPPLLAKLADYLGGAAVPARQLAEIAAAVETFHPGFTPWPDFLPRSDYDRMAVSIERLMNPDTVFEEMDAIVAVGDSTVIENYPLYLRGFLQRAFWLYTETEPLGMTQAQRRLGQAMLKSYGEMAPDDLLPGGRFSADALAAELEDIRSRRSTWT